MLVFRGTTTILSSSHLYLLLNYVFGGDTKKGYFFEYIFIYIELKKSIIKKRGGKNTLLFFKKERGIIIIRENRGRNEGGNELTRRERK